MVPAGIRLNSVEEFDGVVGVGELESQKVEFRVRVNCLKNSVVEILGGFWGIVRKLL
jgi:hypothetical protein